MINKNKCTHRKTKVLKSYRQNYTHGQKSRSFCFNPPKKCTLVCEDCGTKLMRWKPN